MLRLVGAVWSSALRGQVLALGVSALIHLWVFHGALTGDRRGTEALMWVANGLGVATPRWVTDLQIWLATGPTSLTLLLVGFIAGGLLFASGRGQETVAASGYVLFLAAAEGLGATVAFRASAVGILVVGLVAISVRLLRNRSLHVLLLSVAHDVEVAGRVLFAAPWKVISAIGQPHIEMPPRPDELVVATGAQPIERYDIPMLPTANSPYLRRDVADLTTTVVPDTLA